MLFSKSNKRIVSSEGESEDLDFEAPNKFADLIREDTEQQEIARVIGKNSAEIAFSTSAQQNNEDAAAMFSSVDFYDVEF